MLSRLLSCLPSVVSGGLVGLIVALGFQVLPDICCDDDPTVFHLHELLATIVMILLTVSLFGSLNYSARKFVKSGFMLRFKSVLFVGVLHGKPEKGFPRVPDSSQSGNNSEFIRFHGEIPGLKCVP